MLVPHLNHRNSQQSLKAQETSALKSGRTLLSFSIFCLWEVENNSTENSIDIYLDKSFTLPPFLGLEHILCLWFYVILYSHAALRGLTFNESPEGGLYKSFCLIELSNKHLDFKIKDWQVKWLRLFLIRLRPG